MIRIVAPHFVAGIEPYGRFAPILHYMKNWSPEEIMKYCGKKGWGYEWIK